MLLDRVKTLAAPLEGMARTREDMEDLTKIWAIPEVVGVVSEEDDEEDGNWAGPCTSYGYLVLVTVITETR